MSTISVINVKHPSSASNNLVTDSSGNTTAAGTVAMGSSFLRNRIINGAMVIDQRNAGAAITPTDGQYSVDRWKASLNVSSKFSLQQSTTVPTGQKNSLLATSLSAYTIGAGEVTGIMQLVEGLNVYDLGWGASGALSVTLSFWVRSSLTGTFGGSIRNSAANRSYPFSYSVSAANTWEQKSVVIPGDTTGTWLTDNGIGLSLYFSLGSGSTFSATAGAWTAGNYVSATGANSVVGTNGATFYITGVQLEVGTVATPFERRLYGTELALCQRYCLVWKPQVNSGATSFPMIGSGYASSSFTANVLVGTPVALRTTPTISYTGTITFASGSVSSNVTSVPTVYEASNSSFWFQTSYSGTPFTTGNGGLLYVSNSTSNIFIASAEL